MKFGPRTPSLKKVIAARTSPKRFVRHKPGLEGPRGWVGADQPEAGALQSPLHAHYIQPDGLGD